MLRKSRKVFIKLAYVILDIVFLCASIYLACLVRQDTLPYTVTIHNLFFEPLNQFRFVFLSWITVVILLNNANGLYQTQREIYETDEIGKVVRASFLSSLVIIVAIFIIRFEYYPFPRSILILITLFMTVFFSVWRVLKRMFVHYLVSRGYNNFNVLIIGAGKVGRTLAKEVKSRPGLGLNIVGFLEDHPNKIESKDEVNIIGTTKDYLKIVREEFIHEVFITTHHDEKIFMKILEESKRRGIAFRVIPHGFELMTREYFKYNIGFVPIIEYFGGEVIRKQAGKRVFDLLSALAASVVLLPVFVLIAVMIKLDSKGPVFYLSRRFGRSGHTFNMFKFRSMVADAEQVLDKYKDKNEVDGPIFKIKNDPRITNFGRIIRKYSLDELPQIFNVVLGHMSLVGPIPLPITQVEREDLNQLQRLEVRPGITGLWQIRGRSDVPFARLVKWDVWYIDNWSFWLDLNILLQTIPVVIKGRGAY